MSWRSRWSIPSGRRSPHSWPGVPARRAGRSTELEAALIILLLIALNGFFVAAEFAIVGAPRAALERLAQRGSRAARGALAVLRDARSQDRYIATAQLGITLASLGLGMYGEHQVAEWLTDRLEWMGGGRWAAAHAVASATAVLVLTYFHIVLGEMIPKSVALQRASAVALWITPVMRAVHLALYPAVLLLNGLGNGVLRLAGIRRGAPTAEQYRSTDELAELARESTAAGLLKQESAQVAQELLEFGRLSAGDVMTPRVRVVALPLGAGPDRIRDTLRRQSHTRYPVYAESVDRILGEVHVRNLLRCMQSGAALSTEYVGPVPFVPATSTLDQVMTAMGRSRAQLAVVMDEYGGTAGIVTVEDLFEEVVGEYGEETNEPPSLWVDARGRLHAAGTVRLDELASALDVALEHEEVDTVGGLVLAQLGRPPQPGDVTIYSGIRFEVATIEGRGVGEVIVSRADGPDSSPEPRA